VRRPKAVYNGVTWAASLDQQPWTPMQDTVGGTAISAAGVPASFVVRRDELLEVSVVVLEHELAGLLAVVAWGQAAEAFVWHYDADEDVAGTAVYLASPVAGERVVPRRLAGFARAFTLTLVLRKVSGGSWTPA
jgi:hypothetical protein